MKKFLEKAKLEYKFKKAGEGHALQDDSRGTRQQPSTSQAPPSRAVPSSHAQRAGLVLYLFNVCLLLLVAHTISQESDTLALQRDLGKLELWAEKWQMVFNPSKCYPMSVHRTKSPIHRDYTLYNQ